MCLGKLGVGVSPLFQLPAIDIFTRTKLSKEVRAIAVIGRIACNAKRNRILNSCSLDSASHILFILCLQSINLVSYFSYGTQQL